MLDRIVARACRSEVGATAVEYALMLVAILLLCFTAFKNLGSIVK
ncbi:MAG: Flp family type IVb pilin [Acidimicrobiales bacterium]